MNGHVAALLHAHDASAIAAIPHTFVWGASVQAQIKEIAEKLGSTNVGEGAALVGSTDLFGKPYSVPQGNLQDQHQTLLDHLNAHSHDGRYLREAYNQTSKFAVGESRRLITLTDLPEVMPQGIAEATIYHAGTLSSGIRCWSTKVTGSNAGECELWVHNETTSPLFIVVGAYWVAT